MVPERGWSASLLRSVILKSAIMNILNAGFREFMREVIVPIAVAGIAAYAVVKAAMIETEGKPDEKTDEEGKPNPGSACRCNNRKSDDSGDPNPAADGAVAQ
jgi:hypothetical protein